ncbi:putative D-xylulose reductase [Saccostrea echinata]|uniref:putative D-xylulose reductase n=1 Tax=Saccostrea echinata TaxID=191078 RepID=UPI002A7FD601|nr:putative D-xylulose reductase [Saccostrea echinata]
MMSASRWIPCGICGSDVHYYTHGRIGDFIVREPMILGHETSGVISEVGRAVSHLKVGDRVCMEPGVPGATSPETLAGCYNLDPAVRFWATPPVHGSLRESVVHPAAFTFRLPDNVTLAEGALVEPLATGVYAVQRAQVPPGSAVLVLGAGTIGIVTALAARGTGCSEVYIADVKAGKLAFVERHYEGITTIDLSVQSVAEFFAARGIRGVRVIFEASGSPQAYRGLSELLLPKGKLILIGMPPEPVVLDVVSMQIKEIAIESIFRYVNVFPGVLGMMGAGALRVAPLITKTYPFSEAVAAFEYAATAPESEIKIAIQVG